MRYLCNRIFVVAFALAGSTLIAPNIVQAATIVRFETDLGNFDIQLFDDVMPRTVANFLGYVNSGRYDGTNIHRGSDTFDPDLGALRDFVVQGGGFVMEDDEPIVDVSGITLDPAIDDEPGGGVAGPSNVRGTIAMAKSGPDTVTSQWYVNQGDNSVLDNPARPDGGFSAFGAILGNGMDVVDAIGDLPTRDFRASLGGSFGELPVRDFPGSNVEDLTVDNTVSLQRARVLNVAPGDFTRNGFINGTDLGIWALRYGMTEGALFSDGDSDMDGDVDGHDFLAWQRSRGASPLSTPAVGAVPEPSTVAMAAVALGSMLAATRRRRNGTRLDRLFTGGGSEA